MELELRDDTLMYDSDVKCRGRELVGVAQGNGKVAGAGG